MARLALILVLLIAAIPGCKRRDQVDGHPVSYWLDQSYSPDRARQNRAVKALQQFPDHGDASARLAEIREAVAEQREQNWQAIGAMLEDAKRTRDNAATILSHLENCPDQPGPDTPYSPIGFPGRRAELRQLLEQRRDASAGADRQLYTDLLDALEHT